jgi:hypothetical protein
LLLSSDIDPGVNKCVVVYAVTKASLAIMFKAFNHFEKRQFTRAEGGQTPQIASRTPKSLTAPLNISRVKILMSLEWRIEIKLSTERIAV